MPLPLADLPAVLDRDALFTTLLTPRGSTPGTPTYYVSRTPRPTSWERLPARLLNGMLIAASLLLIALVVVTLLPVEKTWRWRKDGCHVQILRLNPSINATLQVWAWQIKVSNWLPLDTLLTVTGLCPLITCTRVCVSRTGAMRLAFAHGLLDTLSPPAALPCRALAPGAT